MSDFKSKRITINLYLLSNKPKSGYVSRYELTNSFAFFNLLTAVSLFRSPYVVRLRTFVNGERQSILRRTKTVETGTFTYNS